MSSSTTAERRGVGSPAFNSVLVDDGVRNVFLQAPAAGASRVDAMAALCRDRVAELTAIPVPRAAALVTDSLKAAMRAVDAGGAATQDDVVGALRCLLTLPALRDVAIKASRLKSLAIIAIDAADTLLDVSRSDAVASMVLRLLRDVDVDITAAGRLEPDTTPLIAALSHSMHDTAAVLLHAGADVNELCSDGSRWPLSIAVMACSEASLEWLLAHGASLTVTRPDGCGIAHLIATFGFAMLDRRVQQFSGRWLRRFIAEEPSLLNARKSGDFTPLMLAVSNGSDAVVSILLELGADVSLATASGITALSLACGYVSLSAVKELVAAGAAREPALPPGTLQARRVFERAVMMAVFADRRCGKCRRCGGDGPGNCAEGREILFTILAAGVCETWSAEGLPVAYLVVAWLTNSDPTTRARVDSVAWALDLLKTAGVDVLAQKAGDPSRVLHAAVDADAPALVRWLVAVAGAPLEEKGDDGYTPLLYACEIGAWAAAHVLLDCGARVDVQGTDEDGYWPVLLVVMRAEPGEPLLQRILAADPDSLLRCTPSGITAIHVATGRESSKLKLLLDSGLPHLSEALDAAFVVEAATRDCPAGITATALHMACRDAKWDAALMLLGAGARVDIAGYIGGRVSTVAEWARRSMDCKHRGVKQAIAARAKEHVSRAGEAGMSSGRSSQAAGSAAADVVPADAGAIGAAARAGKAGTGAGAGLSPVGAGAGTASGVGLPAAGAGAKSKKQVAGARKGRHGAVRNRAEEPSDAVAAAAEVIGASAADRADTSATHADRSGVPAPASASADGSTTGDAKPDGATAAPANAVVHEVNTCEESRAVDAACPAASNTCELAAPCLNLLNLPEDACGRTAP
jgi:ankyrin repeat protein